MAVFSYRAATLDGEPVEGVMEAPGADVAADRLKNAGLIPISVTAPRDAVRKKEEPPENEAGRPPHLHHRVIVPPQGRAPSRQEPIDPRRNIGE